MKRSVSLLISICILCSSSFSLIASAKETENRYSEEKSEKSITEKLKTLINNSLDSFYYVTIELRDSIELSKIDNITDERTGISKSYIEKTSAEINTLSTDIKSETNLQNKDFVSKSKTAEICQKRLELMEIQDEYSSERNKIIKEYYRDKAEAFLSENNIDMNKEAYISMYSPFINRLKLTDKQIKELSVSDDVIMIYHEETGKAEDIGYVYSYTNAGSTCQIIRGNMAPECTIYSYAAANTDPGDVPSKIDYLIDTYNVNVINMSYSTSAPDDTSVCGVYNRHAREIDYTINSTNVTVCVGAGNFTGIYNDNDNGRINKYGVSPNAITVGGVISSGKDQSADNAYRLYEHSSYRQHDGVVNKPDICAPASGFFLGYSDTGTSFATPRVTGAVIQMMSVNPWMRTKPQSIKAAVMASATFNAGTKRDIDGTIASSKEGAGVIDAGFCYQAAYNGRRGEYTFTSGGSNTFTQNVYVDYTDKPFRAAVVWNLNHSDPNDDNNNITTNPDIDVRFKKTE